MILGFSVNRQGWTCKSSGQNQYGGKDFNFGTIGNNYRLCYTTPSFNATTKDLGVDVRVEETKATIMEKYYRECNYEGVIPIRKGDHVEGRFYWNQ